MWDPFRLSETSARSKTRSGHLGDHSRRKHWASLYTSRLGEASSPGRDYQCPLLFAPAQRIHTHPTEVPASPDTHSNTQSQRIHKPQRYKPNHTTWRRSSFPYLEWASFKCLDTEQRSTTALGEGRKAGKTNRECLLRRL